MDDFINFDSYEGDNMNQNAPAILETPGNPSNSEDILKLISNNMDVNFDFNDSSLEPKQYTKSFNGPGADFDSDLDFSKVSNYQNSQVPLPQDINLQQNNDGPGIDHHEIYGTNDLNSYISNNNIITNDLNDEFSTNNDILGLGQVGGINFENNYNGNNINNNLLPNNLNSSVNNNNNNLSLSVNSSSFQDQSFNNNGQLMNSGRSMTNNTTEIDTFDNNSLLRGNGMSRSISISRNNNNRSSNVSEILNGQYFSPTIKAKQIRQSSVSNNPTYFNLNNTPAASNPLSPSSLTESYDQYSSFNSPPPLGMAHSSSNSANILSPVRSPSNQMHSLPKQALSKEIKLKRRRECHNAVERRRRDHIKERIKDLSKLVPPLMLQYDENGKEVKPNKAMILAKTVDYITSLDRVIDIQKQRRLAIIQKIKELQ